jgi:hypothetical protein
VIRFSRPGGLAGRYSTVSARPLRHADGGTREAFVSPRVSYIIPLVARRRHHAIKSDRPLGDHFDDTI